MSYSPGHYWNRLQPSPSTLHERRSHHQMRRKMGKEGGRLSLASSCASVCGWCGDRKQIPGRCRHAHTTSSNESIKGEEGKKCVEKGDMKQQKAVEHKFLAMRRKIFTPKSKKVRIRTQYRRRRLRASLAIVLCLLSLSD